MLICAGAGLFVICVTKQSSHETEYQSLGPAFVFAPEPWSMKKDDPTMAKGTVKWFNVDKGFGFIQPEEGGNDVFVHITAVQEAGLRALEDNQAVEYELVEGRNGRMSAGELKVS